MNFWEKTTGKKKKCHACGEEFSVEPLSCPKCGTKLKTHKAEKWSAMIGGFMGCYAGVWLDNLFQNMGADMVTYMFGYSKHMNIDVSFMAFLIGGVVGSLFCFVVAFLIKKMVEFIKHKKNQRVVSNEAKKQID